MDLAEPCRSREKNRNRKVERQSSKADDQTEAEPGGRQMLRVSVPRLFNVIFSV